MELFTVNSRGVFMGAFICLKTLQSISWKFMQFIVCQACLSKAVFKKGWAQKQKTQYSIYFGKHSLPYGPQRLVGIGRRGAVCNRSLEDMGEGVILTSLKQQEPFSSHKPLPSHQSPAQCNEPSFPVCRMAPQGCGGGQGTCRKWVKCSAPAGPEAILATVVPSCLYSSTSPDTSWVVVQWRLEVFSRYTLFPLEECAVAWGGPRYWAVPHPNLSPGTVMYLFHHIIRLLLFWAL